MCVVKSLQHTNNRIKVVIKEVVFHPMWKQHLPFNIKD